MGVGPTLGRSTPADSRTMSGKNGRSMDLFLLLSKRYSLRALDPGMLEGKAARIDRREGNGATRRAYRGSPHREDHPHSGAGTACLFGLEQGYSAGWRQPTHRPRGGYP